MLADRRTRHGGNRTACKPSPPRPFLKRHGEPFQSHGRRPPSDSDSVGSVAHTRRASTRPDLQTTPPAATLLPDARRGGARSTRGHPPTRPFLILHGGPRAPSGPSPPVSVSASPWPLCQKPAGRPSGPTCKHGHLSTTREASAWAFASAWSRAERSAPRGRSRTTCGRPSPRPFLKRHGEPFQSHGRRPPLTLRDSVASVVETCRASTTAVLPRDGTPYNS